MATYSASYDAPAGINAIVVQDNSAAVILQAADIDHIRADYTYTSSYAFESSKLYDFTVAGSTLTVTKTREPNASLIIQSEDTRSCTLTLQVPPPDAGKHHRQHHQRQHHAGRRFGTDRQPHH